MNSSRKNRIVLYTSFFFLLLGIAFCQENFRLQLVHIAINFSGIALDEHFRSIGLSYLATYLILLGSIGLLYFFHLRNALKEKHFYFFSVSLLLIHYFYHLSANAINFPVYDDQGAILDFLLKSGDATSASEKFRLLLKPYNESMVVFPKLFALCWLKISGQVNFRQLILFNGLLLIAFHLFLFRKATGNIIPMPLFFILSIFVFQFQFYDDAFWVLSGLCFYGVFLMAAAIFYMLQKNSRQLNYLTLFISLVATFTFGNGWTLFPLCIFYLLSEKKKMEIIPWMLTFVLTIIIYFVLRAQFHPLSDFHLNLLDNILFILIFLGSAFQFGYTPHIPVLVGLFIVWAFVNAVRKKQYKTSPVLFFMLAFLIGSAVTAAPLRSGIEPYGQYGIQVRYGIFSIYAIVISIALLLENRIVTNKMLAYLFATAFAYNALTGIFFFPETVLRREIIETVVAGIRIDKYDVKYTTYQRNDIEMLLKEAIKKGIYRP